MFKERWSTVCSVGEWRATRSRDVHRKETASATEIRPALLCATPVGFEHGGCAPHQLKEINTRARGRITELKLNLDHEPHEILAILIEPF